MRLGVLVSGRGSNLAALLDAIDRGDLQARVALVISNRAAAPALPMAGQRGIPVAHISSKTHADPASAMLEALRDHGVDLLVLAGYLRKLEPEVVQAYRDRAVNIHPAPLPRFGGAGMYGLHVHRAVLDAGVRVAGPTVHRVTEEYDEGAALEHREVPVLPDDTPETLAARVLEAEHDLYWRVIQRVWGSGS